MIDSVECRVGDKREDKVMSRRIGVQSKGWDKENGKCGVWSKN